MEHKEITVKSLALIPGNFTGVANFPYGKTWFKEGKWHRTDGATVEWTNGQREWYIENQCYSPYNLELLIKKSIFFGKEKGKYGLEWFRFLTERGIEEFPIISEMEEDKEFKILFEQLGLSV
jgi:hypothetical protein